MNKFITFILKKFGFYKTPQINKEVEKNIPQPLVVEPIVEKISEKDLHEYCYIHTKNRYKERYDKYLSLHEYNKWSQIITQNKPNDVRLFFIEERKIEQKYI